MTELVEYIYDKPEEYFTKHEKFLPKKLKNVLINEHLSKLTLDSGEIAVFYTIRFNCYNDVKHRETSNYSSYEFLHRFKADQTIEEFEIELAKVGRMFKNIVYTILDKFEDPQEN